MSLAIPDIFLFIDLRIAFTWVFSIGCILRENRKKVKHKMFEDMEKEIKRGIGQRLKQVRLGKEKTLDQMAIDYSKYRDVDPISHSIIQTYEDSSAPYHYVLWVHKTFHVDLHWLPYG